MIKDGKTLEQVKSGQTDSDYDPLYGHNSYWTPDMFVEAAYKSLAKKFLNSGEPSIGRRSPIFLMMAR